jgi:sugar (pentulose or hexulose) kinase
MMKCLAFDLGASGGKISVGSFDGGQISLEPVHRFENSAVRMADGLYWDFVGIWREYLRGIAKGLSSHPDIASVGACTYCNDFSFIDRDGELLSPVRAYRDPRAIRAADAIYSIMSAEELYNISGNQIAPFNTLMQLAAMKAEGKDAVLKSADKLLFLPDLFNFYLTGERVTERTIASVTQMYDHASGDWSPEALKRFGIDARLFAPFASAGSAVGYVNRDILKELGATPRADVKAIATAEHDTASAFVGASRADKGTLIISSGTWSLVGCLVNRPIIDEYGFKYNIANEGGLDSGYNRLIRNVMGNWILQEVASEYRREGAVIEYGGLYEEASRLDPYRFVVDADIPEFYEPGNMRAKIRNICIEKYGDAPHTPSEFAACIGASLAFKYRWAMEKLEKLRGRKFNSVSIIGGGSRDSRTAQLTADVTGLPVTCGPVEASTFGNIVFQLLAAGELKNIAQSKSLINRSADFADFEPSDTKRADEAYGCFLRDFGL